MATFAIGDIQGCHAELRRLLQRCGFRPQHDTLWLCGDLCNRGPDSLGVLRLLRDLGDAAVAVLGNHDLKLLAVAHGQATPGPRDTLRQVLDAPDAAALCDWLLTRPLLHEAQVAQRPHALVHAGLLPAWDMAQARAAAAAVQTALRTDPSRFLAAYCARGAPELSLDAAATPAQQTTFAAKVLTTMRLCRPPSTLRLDFSGPPSAAPADFSPWFVWPHRRPPALRLICGHWSALGLLQAHGIAALDTGCVWGGRLTALCLQSDELFFQPCDPNFTIAPRRS